MLNFSNRYFWLSNCIFDKKGKEPVYKLNSSAQDLLQKNMINSDQTFIDLDIYNYLLKRRIIVEEQTNYNPVSKVTELNKCRMFIQLTNKCNLFCSHCFANSSINEKHFFTYEHIINLLNNALDSGITHFDFTGGEVFTQKFFLDILKYLDTKPASYSFFSNLTLVDENTIKELSKLNGLNAIITSVDYYSSEKHDIFRGKKGAWQTTIENILKLKNLGIDVCVNTMVMDDNHLDIWEIVRFFNKYRVPVRFDTIINCGRASCNGNRTDSVYDNVKFIQNVLRWQENQGWKVDNKKGNCGVGDTLIYMHHTGDYMVCPGLTDSYDKSYNLGSDLHTTWKKLKSMNFQCEAINCSVKELCSQGCRARALVDNNNINAPDSVVCMFMGQTLLTKGDEI